MSYPPGQPYGQQPYGGQPNYGAPQGQPGQFGQPQPGTFGQPGYGPGMGMQPPPKKSNAGPWIAVAAVVVVALVLGVGGFVYPGFFVGGSSSDASPSTVMQNYVDAVNNKDADKAKGTVCASMLNAGGGGAGNVDLSKLKTATQTITVSVVSAPTVSGSSATGVINMNLAGTAVKMTVSMNQESGGWCINGFAADTSGGTGGSGYNTGITSSPSTPDDNSTGTDATTTDNSSDSYATDPDEQVVNVWGSAIKNGNASAALKVICSSVQSEATKDVQAMASEKIPFNTFQRVNQSDSAETFHIYMSDRSGTGSVYLRNTTGTWCVSNYYIPSK